MVDQCPLLLAVRGPHDLCHSCFRQWWFVIQDEILPVCFPLTSWIPDAVSLHRILFVTLSY